MPKGITNNALFSACVKGKVAERALQLLQAMQRKRVVPDAITYIAWVSACVSGPGSFSWQCSGKAPCPQ